MKKVVVECACRHNATVTVAVGENADSTTDFEQIPGVCGNLDIIVE